MSESGEGPKSVEDAQRATIAGQVLEMSRKPGGLLVEFLRGIAYTVPARPREDVLAEYSGGNAEARRALMDAFAVLDAEYAARGGSLSPPLVNQTESTEDPLFSRDARHLFYQLPVAERSAFIHSMIERGTPREHIPRIYGFNQQERVEYLNEVPEEPAPMEAGITIADETRDEPVAAPKPPASRPRAPQPSAPRPRPSGGRVEEWVDRDGKSLWPGDKMIFYINDEGRREAQKAGSLGPTGYLRLLKLGRIDGQTRGVSSSFPTPGYPTQVQAESAERLLKKEG